MGDADLRATFEARGWRVHTWARDGREDLVLQREPFRLRWFATQLVTFVYVARRAPGSWDEVQRDYAPFRKFAGDHKRTILPLGIQCGYALLPVYVADAFPDALCADVRSRFVKRWCVMHVPSLLESGTGRLHTLDTGSIWGALYRGYVRDTIAEAAAALAPPA